MSKKNLLGNSALLWLLFGINSHAELPNGVASGDVTQHSAVLWTRSDALGQLTFEYAQAADFSEILGTRRVTVTEPLLPVKTFIDTLEAGSHYYYRATDSSGSSLSGSFSTFANPGTHIGLHFGVSGDSRGDLAPYPALSNVTSKHLDFFTALGDSIYADVESPALALEQATSLNDFRIKHNEVYSAHHGLNTLADLRASTSIFAVIDDHEVTNNFSGAAEVSSDDRFSADSGNTLINDSPLFNNGLQAFLEYNPIIHENYADTGSDPRMDGKVKLYRHRSFGSDAIFIMLDTRSFRDQGLPAVENLLDESELNAYRLDSLSIDRTLLGARQLAELKNDLLAAQANSVTWKFIGIPEPIQNLGVAEASDRFEGYAKERSELLKFINDHDIKNVVFIAADIHGTLINNLTYQELSDAGIRHVRTSAFEITTGPIAYDKPFGPTVIEEASRYLANNPGQLLSDSFLDLSFLENLPLSTRDFTVTLLLNQQLASLGYSAVGLEDSGLDVSLLAGSYSALHSFGWTEFEIDAETQKLRVSTYGIAAYDADDLNNDLSDVLARTPHILSQFEVRPFNPALAQCANFSNALLDIPCVNVDGKQYAAQLSVTQDTPLQFLLASASGELPGALLPGCASYSLQTGQVDLPCVNVGEQRFWANLILIQNQPLSFELNSFGLKN